jgi:hypothetical protein
MLDVKGICGTQGKRNKMHGIIGFQDPNIVVTTKEESDHNASH